MFTQKAQGELLSEKPCFLHQAFPEAFKACYVLSQGTWAEGSPTRHSSIVNWSPSLMLFKGSTFLL